MTDYMQAFVDCMAEAKQVARRNAAPGVWLSFAGGAAGGAGLRDFRLFEQTGDLAGARPGGFCQAEAHVMPTRAAVPVREGWGRGRSRIFSL